MENMNDFLQEIKNNPICVLEGRFRTNLNFLEFIEGNNKFRDEELGREIIFERNSKILGILKLAGTGFEYKSSQKENTYPYVRITSIICEKKEKETMYVEINLEFTSVYDSVGKFFASLSGYSNAKNKLGEFETRQKFLNTSIDEYDFTVRLYNCLKAADIHTVGDILDFKRKNGLANLHNLGMKCLGELQNFLETNKHLVE